MIVRDKVRDQRGKKVREDVKESTEIVLRVSNINRGLDFRIFIFCGSSPATYAEHVKDATKDSQTHNSDDNSDGNLGASAERW